MRPCLEREDLANSLAVVKVIDDNKYEREDAKAARVLQETGGRQNDDDFLVHDHVGMRSR
jgi:hypothetical protein